MEIPPDKPEFRFAQKPSVSTKIEESVKGNSDKPAHKIYKEAVTEGHSVTDKPRNIRQVHYIRERARTEERPTKDAITNHKRWHMKMNQNREKIFIYKLTQFTLHCTCRMPESDLMFQCTKCQQWFHPDCQEIKLNARPLKQSRTVECLEC